MVVGEMAVHEVSFRGAEFKFASCAAHGEEHSSEFSFEVEADVRERWWNPAPMDLVVDVGAGFGSYTLPALALGARVLAFEPDIDCYACLLRNLELNRGFQGRCWPACSALGAKQEQVSYPPAGHPAGSGLIKMKVDTLDRVMEHAMRGRSGKVALIKIDTEGMEAAVLRGARGVIERDRPDLLVEVHRFLDREGMPTQHAQVTAELARHGYRWESMSDSVVDHLWATAG